MLLLMHTTYTVIPSETQMAQGAKVREFFCQFRAATYAARVDGTINGVK